jgi:hypothetical protein
MIGDKTVVLEADGVGFSHMDKNRSLPSARSPEAGRALGALLQILKNRHEPPPLKVD